MAGDQFLVGSFEFMDLSLTLYGRGEVCAAIRLSSEFVVSSYE
jgi:hypothetical protein